MDKFQKFFPLVKIDIAQRIVYGLVTAEAEDKDGETCHYDSTKPEYKAVNDELGKATGGENIMPLREMHQLNAVGAGKSIDFDDAEKTIKMAFKVVDDGAWKKVLEHVLLGFSQGGRYVKKWVEDGKKYYTAQPGEVSLVDNPALPGAYIETIKADGSVEKFRTPSEVSLINTQLEKLTALVGSLVRQDSAAGENMKPEQIKKCAEALGITVEEFTKQFIEGDALEKGKGGLAALGHHLKKAVAHHAKMHEMHKTMADHHATLHEHLQNCMKAHAAAMDGEQSEKVLKALLEEKPPEKKEVDLTGYVKTEAVEEMVKKAVDTATEELKKNMQLRVIPRTGGEKLTADEQAKVEKAAAAGTGF